MNKKIDLIIVGAEKSGTTSLLRYLGSHSDICVHKQLEFPYFILQEEYDKPYGDVFNTYFSDYRNGQKIVAKNVGIMYSESALARLKKHNPDVQLVFLLRNPVERAYSAYWYSKRKGRENARTFAEAISLESKRLKEDAFRWRHNGYVYRGEYSRFIHLALKYFQKEQLHIFLFEEFREDASEACRSVLKTLGLNSETGLTYAKRYNQSSHSRSENLARHLASGSGYMKTLKYFLPQSTLRKVKIIIERLNKTDFDVPAMDKGMKLQLIEYYNEKSIHSLKQLGVNVDIWKL